MKTHKRPELSVEDQELLTGVKVRLIEKAEQVRFDALLEAEHYLHSAALVGEQMRYVAEYEGRWVGLLAWSAAAYNLKGREGWIGWSRLQKRWRLGLVANNSRYLIRSERRVPNLASRVMKLCLDRLSADWEHKYGHPILVVESFVDSELFLGTCYKASGWTLLGQTQGYGRSRQDYYEEHNRPKQLWVREIKAGARTVLRGRSLPEGIKQIEADAVPECSREGVEMAAMMRFFESIPDWRRRDGDYRMASLVTLAVCAGLCGVQRGQRDLAVFAANLTREQMAVLRFPRRGNPRQYQTPKETTFFRFLSHLDSAALEKSLLDWQDHVLGRRLAEDDQVAVDGKELLSSQGVEIVSAYSVKSGRWLGSERVAADSNEIPATQTLLRRAPIEGTLVSADAMHTQAKTAQIITQERGADYLFTVKGNQKTVAESVRQLHRGLQRAFSPSASRGHGATG
jgi:hypothetical protein